LLQITSVLGYCCEDYETADYQQYSCYLYGLEACPLTKSDLLSMDFVTNRFLMKLFKTSNINHVKYCQECFSFDDLMCQAICGENE